MKNLTLLQDGNVSAEINDKKYIFAFDANGYGIYGILLPDQFYYSKINKGEPKKLYTKYSKEIIEFKNSII